MAGEIAFTVFGQLKLFSIMSAILIAMYLKMLHVKFLLGHRAYFQHFVNYIYKNFVAKCPQGEFGDSQTGQLGGNIRGI